VLLSLLAEERVKGHYESAQEMLLWAQTNPRKVFLDEMHWSHARRAFSVEKVLWVLIWGPISGCYGQWKYWKQLIVLYVVA
jgi:hypothetical protein